MSVGLPQTLASSSFATLLGHDFARPELLREALTHRSALRPRAKGLGSNERLEFIGDRVLGLVMAEWLAERFPVEQEGELGRRLAWLVSQPVLAVVAEEIGLAEALSVAPGEARAGVRQRATGLADALEASLGALYLDGGLDKARAFAVVDAMRPIAARHQATVAQVALAWLLSRPQVSTVIMGAKTPEQLTDNLGASNLELTADDLQALEDVSKLPAEYPGWMLAMQAQYRAKPPTKG